jgi:hypothetical protein
MLHCVCVGVVAIIELKKSLYHVFSQYGNILEIYANKRLKNKGQVCYTFIVGPWQCQYR